jgi:hypothetical protein
MNAGIGPVALQAIPSALSALVDPTVMQVNDDGFLRVMHVPEDPFAFLIERPRRYDSGHIGSGHPDAVIPASCGLRVCSDSRNVDERNFEAALECPELVSASDVQRQLAFRYRQINQ